MGKDGMQKCALYSLNLAHYLYGRLSEVKSVKLNFSQNFFNEFIWQIDDARSTLKKLYKRKIIAGLNVGNFYPKLKNGILSCCTEIKSREQIDNFIETLKDILK
jgi:glycine dehydrogenase subunit 1